MTRPVCLHHPPCSGPCPPDAPVGGREPDAAAAPRTLEEMREALRHEIHAVGVTEDGRIEITVAGVASAAGPDTSRNIARLVYERSNADAPPCARSASCGLLSRHVGDCHALPAATLPGVLGAGELAEIADLLATRRRCFGTSAGDDATRAVVGKVPALLASHAAQGAEVSRLAAENARLADQHERDRAAWDARRFAALVGVTGERDAARAEAAERLDMLAASSRVGMAYRAEAERLRGQVAEAREHVEEIGRLARVWCVPVPVHLRADSALAALTREPAESPDPVTGAVGWTPERVAALPPWPDCQKCFSSLAPCSDHYDEPAAQFARAVECAERARRGGR